MRLARQIRPLNIYKCILFFKHDIMLIQLFFFIILLVSNLADDVYIVDFHELMRSTLMVLQDVVLYNSRYYYCYSVQFIGEKPDSLTKIYLKGIFAQSLLVM